MARVGELPGLRQLSFVKNCLTFGAPSVHRVTGSLTGWGYPMAFLSKRRSRPLRCSFCGKPESQVAKLIAGPKVHICDVCVGTCNRILEATPRTFAGCDQVTDEQLLDALRPASATVEAIRSVLQSQVDTLRKRGVSWADIGAALGVSRQAAWERFS